MSDNIGNREFHRRRSQFDDSNKKSNTQKTSRRSSMKIRGDSDWRKQKPTTGYKTDYDEAYIQQLRQDALKWDGNRNKRYDKNDLRSGWEINEIMNNGKKEYWYTKPGRESQWEPPLKQVSIKYQPEAVEKLANETGVTNLVESRENKKIIPPTQKTLRPNKPQLQPDSTGTRGRSQESISTSETPRQRGLSRKRLQELKKIAQEVKRDTPKNRREEQEAYKPKPLKKSVEAPATTSEQSNTKKNPSFARARYISPPMIERPDRRTAWEQNTPGRTLNRNTKKEILKKQFAITDKEFQRRKDLNISHGFDYTDEDLRRIPGDYFYNQVKRSINLTNERKKRNKPQLDFLKQYNKLVLDHYPINSKLLTYLLSEFGNDGYQKTNRLSAIKNYFTINNEGKSRFGHFIANFTKHGVYPLGNVMKSLDQEKLRENPHHFTVLREINEYITDFIRKKNLGTVVKNPRSNEVKAARSSRGTVVKTQEGTSHYIPGKGTITGKTDLPLQVLPPNPKQEDIPYIPDETTNSKFFTQEEDLKSHFLLPTMRKWFETDGNDKSLVKRAGNIKKIKNTKKWQSNAKNTIWVQELAKTGKYDPYSEIELFCNKDQCIEGVIKKEKAGDYKSLWIKIKEKLEEDKRYIVYQGKKNDGRTFTYGFLDTNKAISIGNDYFMLEFITDYHELKFKKDPIKREKITPIFFFIHKDHLYIPDDADKSVWAGKRKILSEYEYRLQYVEKMKSNQTLIDLALLLDYNTTKLYCDSPDARYRHDTAICMYDPVPVMEKWKKQTLVALNDWWEGYEKSESLWNSQRVSGDLKEILIKYTEDIPGETLTKKINKFHISGLGNTILKADRLKTANEDEVRMNVYLTYKNFINNEVSIDDFPQGKTNSSAVIFPKKKIYELVKSAIKNTQVTLRDFINDVGRELNNLIKDCDETQDCHRIILSNINKVVEFKSNKDREFKENLTTLEFIRDELNNSNNQLEDEHAKKVISEKIKQIDRFIVVNDKKWKEILSQKELQDMLNGMINKNLHKLLTVKIDRLDELAFLNLTSAQEKLSGIMQIQEEFQDEQLKFNKITKAFQDNQFKIEEAIMVDIKNKDDLIQKSIREFNTAHAEEIEKKKREAEEAERKRLEEEEKKRKEQAIASALKKALLRWKQVYEQQQREKAENDYRMELIDLYNGAIDENLKIKDEFEEKIKEITDIQKILRIKYDSLDLKLFNKIANQTTNIDIISETFKGANFNGELGKEIKDIERLIGEFDALIKNYEDSKLNTPLLTYSKEKKKDLEDKLSKLKQWTNIPEGQSNMLKLDLTSLNEIKDLDDKIIEIDNLTTGGEINAAMIAVLSSIKYKIEKKKEEINKEKERKKEIIKEELDNIIERKDGIMNSYDAVKVTNKDILNVKYTEIFNLLEKEETIIREIEAIDVGDEENLRANMKKKKEKEEEIEKIKLDRNALETNLNIELSEEERNVFGDMKKQKEDIEKLEIEIGKLAINDEYKELNTKKQVQAIKPLQDFKEELNKVIEIMGYGGEQESFEANETPDGYESKIKEINNLGLISSNLKDILELKLKNLQYQSKLKEIGDKETAEAAKAESIQKALIVLEAKEEEERQRIAEEKRKEEEERQRKAEEERVRLEEEEKRKAEEERLAELERQRLEKERLAELERQRLEEEARIEKEKKEKKLRKIVERIEELKRQKEFEERRNETHSKKVTEINDRILNRLFNVSLKMSGQTYLGDTVDERNNKIKELYKKNHNGEEADQLTMKQWYDKAVQERNEIFG